MTLVLCEAVVQLHDVYPSHVCYMPCVCIYINVRVDVVCAWVCVCMYGSYVHAALNIGLPYDSRPDIISGIFYNLYDMIWYSVRMYRDMRHL